MTPSAFMAMQWLYATGSVVASHFDSGPMRSPTVM